VVADTEISKEIFGNNAFFVRQPVTVDGLARTLEQALTDMQKRGEILRNAEAILKRFTWSAHADRFIRMTRDICSKS
jgi:glycosyltransferase involved in cell wall biosynthesis